MTKKADRLHLPKVLVISWLILGLAGLGVAVAQMQSFFVPMPMIVKNGPPPGQTAPSSLFGFGGGEYPAVPMISADEENYLSYQASSATPTNMAVQVFFARITNNLGTGAYGLAANQAISTNYLLDMAGYFTGSGTVGVSNTWKTVKYYLKGDTFMSQTQGNVLLLFLGSTVPQGGNEALAYVGSVASPYNATNSNYHVMPVSTTIETSTNTAIYLEQESSINFWVTEGGPTNMALKSYLTTVATNAAGGLYLSNVTVASLGSSCYYSGDGLYSGGSVGLTPGGWNKVRFKLKSSGVTALTTNNCMLLFMGVGNNGTNRYEGACVYSVRVQP